MSAPRHVRLLNLASAIEEQLGSQATDAIREIAREFETKPEPEVCPRAVIVASQCEDAARLIGANETATGALHIADLFLVIAGVLRELPTSTEPAPAVRYGTTWSAEPRCVGMTIDTAQLDVTASLTVRRFDSSVELSKRQELRVLALAFDHFAKLAARELAQLDKAN